MAFGLGACLPGLAIAAHGRTATRLPARPVVDSLPLRRKPRRLKRATGTFLRAGAPFKACACRDWLLPPVVALPHACLPIRWWIRFAAAKPRWLKQPTGLFLRATFRIHNHLPPKQKKDIPFGMSFCFGGRWWIRTTEVIDDRFTVCSLWPLGKPSIFNYQLDWSWWTDLNPRPADYKSAALPTELHQRFVKPSVSATCI